MGTEQINRLPEGSTCGEGRVFIVVLPYDVTTLHGNVSAPAGTYEAREAKRDEWTPEGSIVVWAEHYTARGLHVQVPAYDWHFPGEAVRPLPEHNCFDHLASGVAGGVFCGICQVEVA